MPALPVFSECTNVLIVASSGSQESRNEKAANNLYPTPFQGFQAGYNLFVPLELQERT